MTDSIDVAAARAVTPGVAHVIHLNNAGASLAPQPVLDAMIGHLERESVRGGYEAEAEAHDRIEAVYGSVARLLNAAPDEIALVDSATRAWDSAFYTFAATLRPGERIVTGRAEYASNVIALLQIAHRSGVIIDVIEDDASGAIDVSALASRLDPHVRLVCVTHVPTSGGLVNPVAEIGKVTQAAGIPYLVDACQSAGQLPLDVEAIGCDALQRDRPQVPPRAPRHRLPVRAPRPDRRAGAAVPRPALRDVDRSRPVRDPRRRAAVRDLGELDRDASRPRRGRRPRARLGPRGDRGPCRRARGKPA